MEDATGVVVNGIDGKVDERCENVTGGMKLGETEVKVNGREIIDIGADTVELIAIDAGVVEVETGITSVGVIDRVLGRDIEEGTDASEEQMEEVQIEQT